MSWARRFGGSLLGAALTVVGWVSLGVADFGPRLLVAFAGFLVGRVLVRLALGPPPPPSADAKSAPGTSRSLGAGLVAGLVIGVLVFAGFLYLVLRRNADRHEAEARADDARAAALAQASAAKASTTTEATTNDFPLRVEVDPRGIRVDGVSVTKEQLTSLAKEAKAKHPGTYGVVAADPAVPYSDIVDVMDRLITGGVVDVRLAELEKKPP